MFSCSSDKTVKVWSVGQQKCISTWDIHSASVWCLELKDGCLYSGDVDGCLYQTNLEKNESWLLGKEESALLDVRN